MGLPNKRKELGVVIKRCDGIGVKFDDVSGYPLGLS